MLNLSISKPKKKPVEQDPACLPDFSSSKAHIRALLPYSKTIDCGYFGPTTHEGKKDG